MKLTPAKIMMILGADPEEHGSEPADKWDALGWIVAAVLVIGLVVL